jgi:hypothetical protein
MTVERGLPLYIMMHERGWKGEPVMVYMTLSKMILYWI